MNLDDAQRALVETGRELYQQGWVPATSGNFSVRLGDGSIAITASGRDKGRLAPVDIIHVDVDGKPLDGGTPSAETGLHLRLYARDTVIGAVLHTHSVNSSLMSMQNPDGLRFEGVEILKAFAGIDSHEESLQVPVFANNQDIEALGRLVDRYMDAHGHGAAYLIAGHGSYTWGRDLPECRRHLEALEYLFEYRRLGGK